MSAPRHDGVPGRQLTSITDQFITICSLSTRSAPHLASGNWPAGVNVNSRACSEGLAATDAIARGFIARGFIARGFIARGLLRGGLLFGQADTIDKYTTACTIRLKAMLLANCQKTKNQKPKTKNQKRRGFDCRLERTSNKLAAKNGDLASTGKPCISNCRASRIALQTSVGSSCAT